MVAGRVSLLTLVEAAPHGSRRQVFKENFVRVVILPAMSVVRESAAAKAAELLAAAWGLSTPVHPFHPFGME
jgi:hypothetical protein